MRRTFVVGRVDGKTTEIRLVERRTASQRELPGGRSVGPDFGSPFAVAAVVHATDPRHRLRE